jgi:hypothetical protein
MYLLVPRFLFGGSGNGFAGHRAFQSGAAQSWFVTLLLFAVLRVYNPRGSRAIPRATESPRLARAFDFTGVVG